MSKYTRKACCPNLKAPFQKNDKERSAIVTGLVTRYTSGVNHPLYAFLAPKIMT